MLFGSSCSTKEEDMEKQMRKLLEAINCYHLQHCSALIHPHLLVLWTLESGQREMPQRWNSLVLMLHRS